MKQGKTQEIQGGGIKRSTCGTCGKTVRLADFPHLVACTVKLATMPADHDQPCAHYVVREAGRSPG